MWPGCSTEFNGLRPSYTVAFNDYIKFDDKVNQVFDWFDLPLQDRPQFIGLYVQQIDQAGHAHGPYANEVRALNKSIYMYIRLQENDYLVHFLMYEIAFLILYY